MLVYFTLQSTISIGIEFIISILPHQKALKVFLKQFSR